MNDIIIHYYETRTGFLNQMINDLGQSSNDTLPCTF